MRVCCTLLLLTLAWPHSHAEAQCPIHLPFVIRVEMSGVYENSTSSSDTSSPPTRVSIAGKNVYSLLIDTAVQGSSIAFAGDSLAFYVNDTAVMADYGTTCVTVRAHFDTLLGIITSLSIRSKHDYDPWFAINTNATVSWGVSCSNIRYTPDSILATGLLSPAQLISLSDDSSGIVRGCIPPFTWYSGERKLVSGSAGITGVSKPVSSVATGPSSLRRSDLAYTGNAGFSFTPSNHARLLEVYSPIGTSAARVDIPAGQSDASIRKLPSGLYFVRLGGSVVKIYVPE